MTSLPRWSKGVRDWWLLGLNLLNFESGDIKLIQLIIEEPNYSFHNNSMMNLIIKLWIFPLKYYIGNRLTIHVLLKKGLTIHDIGWTQLKKNQTLQQDQQATGLTFSCNYKIIFKLFYV